MLLILNEWKNTSNALLVIEHLAPVFQTLFHVLLTGTYGFFPGFVQWLL